MTRRFYSTTRALLLLLAVVLSITAGVYFARFLFKANTGLVVNFPEVIVRDGKVVFSPKTPFSHAAASGLIPHRDIIVMLDGTPIRNSHDVVRFDMEHEGYDPIRIEVLRDAGERRLIVLTPYMSLSRPDWLLMLFFALLLDFTAFYLFFLYPYERSSQWLILACLFYLVFTCVKPFYYESLFANFLIHLGKVTSWLLVFFALFYPYPRWNKYARTIFILSIMLLFLTFLSFRLHLLRRWMDSGQELFLTRYRFLGRIGNLSDAVAYLAFLYFIATAYMKSRLQHYKKHLEWIAAGFLVALPPYFFFDQLPLILGNEPSFRISLGNFSNAILAIFPLFFIAGLLKRTGFDFGRFIARYVSFFLTTVVILLLFLLLFETLTGVVEDAFEGTEAVAGFVITFFLFLLLIPIELTFRWLLSRVSQAMKRRAHVCSRETKDPREQALSQEEVIALRKTGYRDLKLLADGINEKLKPMVSKLSRGLLAMKDLEKKVFVTEINEEYEVHFESLCRENARIRSFVDQVHRLSSLSAAPPAAVEMSLLVNTAVSRFLSAEPDVTMRRQVEATLVQVIPEDIIGTLIRIFENAAEASQKRIVAVRCYSHQGDCRTEVKDEGWGIPPTVLKRIFNPFVTTKQNHEGLGLFLSKYAVERNGGKIEIWSETNHGTTARISIPQAIEPGRENSASLT
jgi:signal transduction histidine kinase